MHLCSFCNRCNINSKTIMIVMILNCRLYESTGWPKKFGTIILYALTLTNINRFSKLFHYQNQEIICNNTVTKDPTIPQCVATLPCEMSSVLKATIENKTTSATTH